MLLSIVIPTYKRNIKLRRLLKSIGEHDFVQIIVIDDSMEFEANLLNKEFNYVHFYTNECNKGAGGARNTGVKYAIGEYIVFADSDDMFLSGWFEIINKYIHKDFDVVYFLPSSFLENNINQSGYRHERYKRLIRKYELLNSNDILYYFYVPWSKLIRLDFIKSNKILFDEIPASNDINFSLSVGLLNKCFDVCLNGFYAVEDGDKSLTKNVNSEILTCRLDALFRFNNKLNEFNLNRKKLMMAPWLFKLFICSPKLGVTYLLKGIVNKTPIFFDYRFKRFKK